MKRKIHTILCCVIVGVLALTGCGSNSGSRNSYQIKSSTVTGTVESIDDDKITVSLSSGNMPGGMPGGQTPPEMPVPDRLDFLAAELPEEYEGPWIVKLVRSFGGARDAGMDVLEDLFQTACAAAAKAVDDAKAEGGDVTAFVKTAVRSALAKANRRFDAFAAHVDYAEDGAASARWTRCVSPPFSCRRPCRRSGGRSARRAERNVKSPSTSAPTNCTSTTSSSPSPAKSSSGR